MTDYKKAIYKAISCKTPTKGTPIYVDDFGDVWITSTQLNRFGEQSTHHQYAGNLLITPTVMQNGMNGNYLHVGEFIPTYHFSVFNPTPNINGYMWQLQTYLDTRLVKVKERYQKKPLRNKG